MADQDRELALRITADASAAKAELDSLQKSEQGLVTSTTQSTAATAASATAIQQQGDAAEQSSGQISDAGVNLSDLGNAAQIASVGQAGLKAATLETATAMAASTVQADAHVAAYRADQAQMQQIVLAMQEARLAIAALSTAVAVGGTEMTVALGRASIAMGAFNAQTLAGASSAQRIGIAALENQFAALLPQVGGATRAAEGFAGSTRLVNLGASAAGKAVESNVLSVAKLSTGLLRVAGPIGVFISLATLAYEGAKLLAGALDKWSMKIAESIVGLSEQDGVVRKNKETTEAYTARVNQAADAQALHERALYAASRGAIAHEESVEKMDARYRIWLDSAHLGGIL